MVEEIRTELASEWYKIGKARQDFSGALRLGTDAGAPGVCIYQLLSLCTAL